MTTKIRYRKDNPLRIKSGAAKGKFPHELSEIDFLEFLVKQGMTRDDYESNLQSGDKFAKKVEKLGKAVTTSKLTHDQRGWAKHDHFAHFNTRNPRWFILEEKPSKPIPAVLTLKRNLDYGTEECSCDAPEMAWWAQRYDEADLLQCDNCGEVVIAPEGHGV